jgi:hypothetical protein
MWLIICVPPGTKYTLILLKTYETLDSQCFPKWPTDFGIGVGTSGDPPFDALFVLPCRLRRTRPIKDLHITRLKTVLTVFYNAGKYI